MKYLAFARQNASTQGGVIPKMVVSVMGEVLTHVHGGKFSIGGNGRQKCCSKKLRSGC